jgi:hypothetical protein
MEASAEDHPTTSAATPFEEARRQIDTTLAVVDATKIDLAVLLLAILEKASEPDRPKLLRHLAEHWDHRASSAEMHPEPIISEAELNALKKRYGRLVDGHLDMLLGDNMPADDYYAGLYEMVRNPIFAAEHARAFALYWALIDNRTPYFQLGEGVKVSNEDWRALAKRLREPTARINFILSSDTLVQRSEEADLILREICSREDTLEQVRLMASLLWVLRAKAERELSALLKDHGPAG